MGIVVVLGASSFAAADTLTRNLSLTNGIQSASAEFVFDDNGGSGGATLTVTVTNTMMSNSWMSLDGPSWLNGVFWNLTNASGLMATATGVTGHLISLDGTTQSDYDFYDPPDNMYESDPAHFWTYRDDIDDSEYGSFLDSAFGDTGRQYGLGAAGYDIFSMMDSIDYDPNGPMPQPDGPDGGILPDIIGLQIPPGQETYGNDGPPTAYALDSLVFEFALTDNGGNFDLANFAGLDVEDIAFVFGTGFDEVVLIPLPPALPLGLAGLAGVAFLRRRITRGKRVA